MSLAVGRGSPASRLAASLTVVGLPPRPPPRSSIAVVLAVSQCLRQSRPSPRARLGCFLAGRAVDELCPPSTRRSRTLRGFGRRGGAAGAGAGAGTTSPRAATTMARPSGEPTGMNAAGAAAEPDHLEFGT